MYLLGYFYINKRMHTHIEVGKLNKLHTYFNLKLRILHMNYENSNDYNDT